jgi:hypothetical protein
VLEAGVSDPDGKEGYREEVSELFCETSEMFRPRNNVSECDNSCDLNLDADDARIVTATEDRVVPVDDYVIVKVCWWEFSGQREGCKPGENVGVICDDQAMFKPLWQRGDRDDGV